MSNEEHRVSYAEWESGKVKFKDEIFDPDLGEGIYYEVTETGEIIGKHVVIGYKGRETGMKVGLWFAEVMEPIELIEPI